MWGDIVVGSVKYHDSHGPKERFKPLRQFRTTKITLDGRINTSKLKFWGTSYRVHCYESTACWIQTYAITLDHYLVT